MAKPNQGELLRRLSEDDDPAARRDAALALLGATRSREKVDRALDALARKDVAGALEDEHRAALIEAAGWYFERSAEDLGGLLRERFTRILAADTRPAEAAFFERGVRVYLRQSGRDIVGGLRAAALAGLCRAEPDLGAIHATRLLGEPDTNEMTGEPSLAAIDVLVAAGQPLPVYLFALRLGEAFIERKNGEVVGRAFAVLARELPADLYLEAAGPILDADDPAAGSGIVDGVTSVDDSALLPLVERILDETRHRELLSYAAVMLATSRKEAQRDLLCRRAREAGPGERALYAEAVELTAGDGRDELLARLRTG